MVEDNSPEVEAKTSLDQDEEIAEIFDSIDINLVRAHAYLRVRGENIVQMFKAVEEVDKNLDKILTNVNQQRQIQFERTQVVAKILMGILTVADKNPVKREKYTIYLNEQKQLILTQNSDGSQLMKASYNTQTSQWEPIERPYLTQETVECFTEVIPELEKALRQIEQAQQEPPLQHRRGRGR